MNNRQFMKALNEIDDRYILEATDTEHIKELFKGFEEDGDRHNKNLTFRKNAKKLLLAAIISALILAVGVVTAVSITGTFEITKEFGDRIFEMLVGERTEYKGYTIIRENDAVRFETVEVFLKKQIMMYCIHQSFLKAALFRWLL